MKKSLLTIMAAAFAGMATFFGGVASAGQYPVAPPPHIVTLTLDDFIQSVPYTSWTGAPDPYNPVIGDNLNQHPGAFYTGQPSVGAYFIGVFGTLIDASRPDTTVYLWETTSVGFDGQSGPQIQLGHWDGTSFTPEGISVAASFYDTLTLVTTSANPLIQMELNCSTTPLRDFEIQGNPILNAVEIEAADINAHNQVIAVAVPEPSATLLLGGGLACLLGCGRQRKKKPLRSCEVRLTLLRRRQR
jgi:hypothetical protein